MLSSNTAKVISGTSQLKKRFLATSTDLVKTALNELHKELGGDMVPFAGYELPVLYKGDGVMKEHLWCRSEGKASLFDVSHMGQVRVHDDSIEMPFKDGKCHFSAGFSFTFIAILPAVDSLAWKRSCCIFGTHCLRRYWSTRTRKWLSVARDE